MTRYLIVIEKTDTGFSAYSPDLPGCVSAGASMPEVEAKMRDAVVGHLDELREDGTPVPAPTSFATYVEAPA